MAEIAGAKGMLLAVVGPSGAGKDTLLAAVRENFGTTPGLHIVRRVITRPAEAGGEDHQPATVEAFHALREAGAFATWWEAHGLLYGIPVEARQRLEAGELVLANGSRSALPHFKPAFARLKVLNITARPEVLAERLAARGRETREEILRRLSRGGLDIPAGFDVETVDNSGSLDDAKRTILEIIARLVRLN